MKPAVGKGTRRPLYRAVALDVDGTLVDSRGGVSERTRQALASVRRRGVQVVLATGRHPHAVQRLCRELGLEGLQICVNGALLVDPLSGEVALARWMEARDVEEILAFLDRHGFGRAVHGPEVILTDRADLVASFAASEEWRVEYVPEIAGRDATVLKVTGFPPPQMAFEEAFRLVKEAVGARFAVTSGDGASVEIAHPEATKGGALVHWCRIHGIAPAEVVAIGDSYNDLELLRVAGMGVAVANAVPELRRVARLVVGSCDEDGVAEALGWLFGVPGASPLDDGAAVEG